MERPHHGLRRSPQPRAQSPHRPHRRTLHRRCSLHRHQRRHPVHPARVRHRRLAAPRRRRARRRHRPLGSRTRHRSHGPQHPRHAQRNHNVRSAYPLRRRPRPPLLPPHGRHSPTLPEPFHRPHRAGPPQHRLAARRRTLPAALRARHLLRVALLHDHLNHHLLLPPQAPQNIHLPRLGIPSSPRPLHRRRRRPPLLLLHREPEELHHRQHHHPLRNPPLPTLPPPQPHTRPTPSNR